MNILIQIGHPAQFHFYKNAVKIWQENGHKVRLLIKTKDVLEKLVVDSGFEYINFEHKIYDKSSKIQLLKMASTRFYNYVRQMIIFRPDIIIGLDPILAKISRLCKSKFIAVAEDDYQIIKALAYLLFPSADTIFAPRVCDYSPWQSKKVEYEGYMKLAYLHPKRFVANRELIKPYLRDNNPYILIRLVSLTAYHDENIKGINNPLLDRIIERFKAMGYSVYISSEKALSEPYCSYQLASPVDFIHHIMAFASFLVCDSQSMAVEAAMLGVPSIRFNDFAGKISVLEELEHKYGLTYGIKTDQPERLFEKINELLAMPNLREEFQLRRQKMLADKIDVTAFLAWFIENYPKSKEIMKSTPDYQYGFK